MQRERLCSQKNTNNRLEENVQGNRLTVLLSAMVTETYTGRKDRKETKKVIRYRQKKKGETRWEAERDLRKKVGREADRGRRREDRQIDNGVERETDTQKTIKAGKEGVRYAATYDSILIILLAVLVRSGR